MKPTAEFRRQHDVEPPRVDATAFRQGWRVRTRLDHLLSTGRINRSEWQAASEYRQTWAIARELVGIEPGMIRVAGASDADAAMIARIDAASRLRIVEEVIGSEAARLLLASVVHDFPWARIGQYWRRDPKTVRDWVVVAIRDLALAWEGAPRRLPSDPPSHSRRRVRAA